MFDQYDFAIMIHLDNKNRSAVKTLCIMDLKVDFFGKSSHAASAPWEDRNALNGVQLFFHAVDMLRQHVTPYHDAWNHSGRRYSGKYCA